MGKAKSFEGKPKMTKIKSSFLYLFCVYSFHFRIKYIVIITKINEDRKDEHKHQQIRKILKQQKSDKKKKKKSLRFLTSQSYKPTNDDDVIFPLIYSFLG